MLLVDAWMRSRMNGVGGTRIISQRAGGVDLVEGSYVVREKDIEVLYNQEALVSVENEVVE